MNKDLIKRIDEALEPPTDIGSAWVVLEDCRAEIDRLNAELETERMRLCACGVVADSNTRESALRNRDMCDEYKSASLSSVIRAVDSEIELREKCARLEDELAKAKWYEPMTDDEFHTIWIASDGFNATETLRLVEAELIKRAGLVVKEKE